MFACRFPAVFLVGLWEIAMNGDLWEDCGRRANGSDARSLATQSEGDNSQEYLPRGSLRSLPYSFFSIVLNL